jgi:hypothetical protein
MQIPRWNYQILLLVCLLLSGCGQNKVDKTGDIPVIDVLGSFGKHQAIPVSQFVSELEYIPLETRDDCLIGGWLGSIVTSTHIFVLGEKFCYAFDRNGRFLGQIGNAGQGPGEYPYLVDFTVDEKKHSLYFETLRTLLEYSWDGVFQQSINLPKDKHGTPLTNIIFVRDNLFLGHSRNYKGDLNHNFILFDDSSEVVKSFDNHVQFNRAHPIIGQDDRSMKPYRKGEYVHIKEISNDTLFYLNEQNELIPQYIFDLGEYTITKEIRENLSPEDNTKKIILPVRGQPMMETPSYVFFQSYCRQSLRKIYFS